MNSTLKSIVEEELQKAYERGVQDGMKQERALWELTKVGQEIEEDEYEYCDHGIRYNRHCKSCECIEQADMRSEM